MTTIAEDCSRRKISLCAIRIIFTVLVILCVPDLSASFHHNIKYSVNIVKTKYGPLRGIIVRSNPTVEAFLGVPYASPPVGSLRFMPPVTPSTWRTTRLADRYSAVCPQALPTLPEGPEALLEVPRGRLAQLRRLLPLLANQSEDCLYLNLYVPRKSYPASSSGFGGDVNIVGSNGKISSTLDGSNGHPDAADAPQQNKPLPAIVYIHGESYEWNSGNPYDGSVLAAHGSVIVITINFRLGILGFLKTGGKGSAQGNFGLMDLVAGLHWLRENLPAFGGDPDKVTIMGHGSGAALANILVVSPVANDLVHRAILLSGSALSPWAIQKDPLFVKRRVAEQTGCHGNLLVDDLAPCLRTKPIAELLAVKIDSPRFLPGFAPFIDGTVIAYPSSGGSNGPLTLPAGSAIASTSGIELADFPSRELIFGLTTIESYLDFNAQDLEFGFNETRRDRILRTYVRNVYHYHLNEIYAALKNEYTDWERSLRNPMGSRDASLEFLSDGHTAAPLIRLGYLHSLRGGRSYFLHFRHQSGERDFPQRSGSVRGEDVPFCLGLPISSLFPFNYTKQDIKISKLLVRYISNFALNGNPNDIQTTSHDISHIVHGKSAFLNPSLPLTSASLTLSLSSSAISSLSRESPILIPPDPMSSHRNLKHNNEQYPSSSSLKSSSSSLLLTPPSSSSLLLSSPSVSSSSHLSSPVSRLLLSLPSSSSSSFSSLSSLSSSTSNDKTSAHYEIQGSLREPSVNFKRHAIGNILRRRKRKTIKYDGKKYPTGGSVNKFFQRKKYPIAKLESNSPEESDSFVADQGITSTITKMEEQPNHHHHHHHGNENQDDDEDEVEDEDEEEDDEEEDDDEDEFSKVEDDDEHNAYKKKSYISGDIDDEEENVEKFDRLDDVTIIKLPFWDTYDAINQLYLEMGSKVEIRNHYRGHKLSMWLSLIPQLHSPADLNELPMRHHHFVEENAQYYDGIIRPQIMQRPSFPKINVQQPSGSVSSSTHQATTSKINSVGGSGGGVNSGAAPAVTTECPPNTTIVPTIAATRPQNHQQNGSGPSGVMSPPVGAGIAGQMNKGDNNNLFRRLANTQYQSYTTALLVTIAVGCFLLILNILIFAGIYYQREKRANDAKKKEELQEAENRCIGSPSLEKIGRSGKGSRKSSLQSLTGFDGSGSFGEYSCYEEKLQCKEKHALADICSVELPLKEFKCSSSSPVLSNTGSLRRPTNVSNTTSILMYPPSYHHNAQQNPHKTMHHFPEQQQQGCSNSSLVTYQQYQKPSHQHHHHHQQQQQQQQHLPQKSASTVSTSTELCNQSTQSEQPSVQDVGTSVDEKVVGSSVNSISKGDVSNSSKDVGSSSIAGVGGGGGGGGGLSSKGGGDDDMISPGIPQPPPPPKSSVPYQGGILRQPGPPTTPGSSKKRVQIQEISV